MFAKVNVVFGVRENASVIPEEAIVPQGGKQFVIKLQGGSSEETRKTQRVEVKVGLRSPGKVEILEGLSPGDTVVRTGQQRIQKDGTVVSVVNLNSTPTSAEATTDQKPAGSLFFAPASSVREAAKSSPSGPNPCGTIMTQLPAAGSVMPTSGISPAVHKPATTAIRNPG
jgi:membrane fusion protein (multidrug efflux system)